MAIASAVFKSSEDHRKQLELEEARKAGLAPAEVDENGKEIKPHIPRYMSSAPWYLNAERPFETLKWKSDPNYTKSWYDRGAKTFQADKFRKGACEKYGGNCTRVSGQALEFKQLNIHAWEAFDKGHDVHMQAAPSQADLLNKNFKINKEKLKSQSKETIMEKYGNAATDETLPWELLLGQSEREVEYDRAGRIIKGQETSLPKSKYEEDIYINNHTPIWGSWWKDHQWGYKCCQQTVRNSYCTSVAGIEAADAATDLMKANIARKEIAEETPTLVEEKKLASWGSEVPSDLVLDEKKHAEALKREDDRRGGEDDERKRKYNVEWNDEVTPEDMEAYRMKSVHQDDPMKDFLH